MQPDVGVVKKVLIAHASEIAEVARGAQQGEIVLCLVGTRGEWLGASAVPAGQEGENNEHAVGFVLDARAQTAEAVRAEIELYLSDVEGEK